MKFRKVIGLDIEPREIKAVHLARRGPFVKICATERVRLPESEAEARRILQRVVETHGWRQWPCVIGLHGESTLLRVLAIPASDTRPLAVVVGERMESFRTMSSSRTVEEFAVLHETNRSRRVLVGLTRMDHLQRMLELPEQAGLQIVKAMPRPLAVFNAAVHFLPRRFGAFAVIHLGWNGTEVFAGHGRVPLFVRHFNLGARILEANHEDPLPADWPLQAPKWQQWLEELDSCLRLYRQEHPARRQRLTQLVLCGVRPLAPGVAKAIAAATGLRVERLDDIHGARRLPEAGRHAAAFGLALTGIGKPALTLSLLPARVKEQLVLRWQFKYWLGGGLAAAASLAVMVAGLQRQWKADETLLEARERRLAIFLQQDSIFQDHARRNEQLRRQVHPLRASIGNGALAGRVLKTVSLAKHPDDWITLLADADSYFRGSRPDPEAKREGARTAEPTAPRRRGMVDHVVVEGFTPTGDLSTIRAMIERLRANPEIMAVDLLGDDKVAELPLPLDQWPIPEWRRFAIEISLRAP